MEGLPKGTSNWAKSAAVALPSIGIVTFLSVSLERLLGSKLTQPTSFGYMWIAFNVASGFLILVRVQQAYSRWWESCALLKQMHGEWYNAVSTLVACCTPDREKRRQVVSFQHLLVRLMSMLYCSALQQVTMMDDSCFEIIDNDGIGEESLRYLQRSRDRCEVLMQWIQRLIVNNMNMGVFKPPPSVIVPAIQELSRGAVNLSNVKKIKEFPPPFPYEQIIACLLHVHWGLAPIANYLLVTNAFWAGALSFVSIFAFWSINSIAQEIETPFSSESSDQSIAEMQMDMNRSLWVLLELKAQNPPAFDFAQEVHMKRRSKLSVWLSKTFTRSLSACWPSDGGCGEVNGTSSEGEEMAIEDLLLSDPSPAPAPEQLMPTAGGSKKQSGDSRDSKSQQTLGSDIQEYSTSKKRGTGASAKKKDTFEDVSEADRPGTYQRHEALPAHPKEVTRPISVRAMRGFDKESDSDFPTRERFLQPETPPKASGMVDGDAVGRARALLVEARRPPLPVPPPAEDDCYADEEVSEEVYLGTVKSFNDHRGFGFISCEDTTAVYGRDVYMSREEARYAAHGHSGRDKDKSTALAEEDIVQFRVRPSVEGFPQALEVQRLRKFHGVVICPPVEGSNPRVPSGRLQSSELEEAFGQKLVVAVSQEACGRLGVLAGDEVTFCVPEDKDADKDQKRGRKVKKAAMVTLARTQRRRRPLPADGAESDWGRRRRTGRRRGGGGGGRGGGYDDGYWSS